MKHAQEFRINFYGKMGRDRKVKSHSIVIGELSCMESGHLFEIERMKVEDIKNKAREVINSARDMPANQIPQLKSLLVTYENFQGIEVRTITISPYSDKNKVWLF